MSIDVEVGDNIYCPKEGWSGEVVEIVDDDGTGSPGVAVLKSHDPNHPGPWICLPLNDYDQNTASGLN